MIFLEKGHTQNCNDSIHASIEKAEEGINIHHPGRWDTVVQMTCKNQPYEVKRMSQKEFSNFSTNINGIFDNLRKKPRGCSTGKPVKVNWTEVKHAEFAKPRVRARASNAV